MRTTTAMSMLATALLLSARMAAAADELNVKSLEQAYQPDIRPLIQRYCHECHAGKTTEAEIDLAAFATWANDLIVFIHTGGTPALFADPKLYWHAD